jgi:hypothetical protein
MTPPRLAQALVVFALTGQSAVSLTYPADVPSLGYSPQNMDRTVDFGIQPGDPMWRPKDRMVIWR